MNKVILCGRLTKDPDIRYSQNDNSVSVAKYTLAVDRKYKKEGEPSADFINITALGKAAEFTEKYLKKGTKIIVTGRIQTGSYTNKDGQKVYTTDVIVEEQEFAESKNAAQQNSDMPQTQAQPTPAPSPADGFMNVPEGIDEDLPFARI